MLSILVALIHRLTCYLIHLLASWPRPLSLQLPQKRNHKRVPLLSSLQQVRVQSLKFSLVIQNHTEQTAESAQPSGPPDRKQPPTSENIAHPQRNNPSPSLQNSAPPTSEKKEGHVPAEQRRQQSRSQGQGRETNHRGDHQRSNRGLKRGGV